MSRFSGKRFLVCNVSTNTDCVSRLLQLLWYYCGYANTPFIVSVINLSWYVTCLQTWIASVVYYSSYGIIVDMQIQLLQCQC